MTRKFWLITLTNLILLGLGKESWCKQVVPSPNKQTYIKSPSTKHKGYIQYKVDYSPMDRWPKLKKDFLQLRQETLEKPASDQSLKNNLFILNAALKATPNWIDGLWMQASFYFQMALALDPEMENEKVLNYLTLAEASSKKCHSLDRTNPLCQLFLASIIAHRGTIDGVLSAISKAEQVESLWLNVARSKYNYNFTNYITMQGAVRYALGIFYRLVPDSALVNWLYGVRGDLDKSITLHRTSLAIDDPRLPCSNLMLGVALICSSDEDPKDKRFTEGMSILTTAKNSNFIFSVNSKLCRRDANHILKKPEDACGYSTAKQQEEIDDSQLVKK